MPGGLIPCRQYLSQAREHCRDVESVLHLHLGHYFIVDSILAIHPTSIKTHIFGGTFLTAAYLTSVFVFLESIPTTHLRAEQRRTRTSLGHRRFITLTSPATPVVSPVEYIAITMLRTHR